MLHPPRTQYSNYLPKLDHINQKMSHVNTRLIEKQKNAVKLYAIVVILGMGAGLLLYQNAGAFNFQSKLQYGNLSVSFGFPVTCEGDLQKAVGDGWKETTLLFERSTKYLARLLH